MSYSPWTVLLCFNPHDTRTSTTDQYWRPTLSGDIVDRKKGRPTWRPVKMARNHEIDPRLNKMQSTTADFAPVPPPGDRDKALGLLVISDSANYLYMLCDNLTPSTKPEIYNISHCCRGRTEPRPQLTCTKRLLKFRRVVFEICQRTNRHTDALITILHTAIRGKVKISAVGPSGNLACKD